MQAQSLLTWLTLLTISFLERLLGVLLVLPQMQLPSNLSCKAAGWNCWLAPFLIWVFFLLLPDYVSKAVSCLLPSGMLAMMVCHLSDSHYQFILFLPLSFTFYLFYLCVCVMCQGTVAIQCLSVSHCSSASCCFLELMRSIRQDEFIWPTCTSSRNFTTKHKVRGNTTQLS